MQGSAWKRRERKYRWWGRRFYGDESGRNKRRRETREREFRRNKRKGSGREKIEEVEGEENERTADWEIFPQFLCQVYSEAAG